MHAQGPGRLQAAVVVCSWCDEHGRPHAAARPLTGRHWTRVSHEFSRAVTRAGLASHGVCPACLALLAGQPQLDPSRRPA